VLRRLRELLQLPKLVQFVQCFSLSDSVLIISSLRLKERTLDQKIDNPKSAAGVKDRLTINNTLELRRTGRASGDCALRGQPERSYFQVPTLDRKFSDIGEHIVERR